VAARTITRAVAVVALAATVVYLSWRGLDTLNLQAWYLSVPLLLRELQAAVGLALYAFSLWDVDRRPAAQEPDPSLSVAVLIPTYNEGIEILLPTVAAALALEPAHETWILDDGDRPAVAELAAVLGARYLTRPDHAHAKAGNLNHALKVVKADLVAVLDADHVARPAFPPHTRGYFPDPRLALVQTPQDFYNVTSFEHGTGDTYGEPFHEQTLFYRLLEPGKNRWEAAFWCGTGAVVRRAALEAVGGVATETITEDIHTTIRMHRRGWKTVYHNEVLVKGLAATDVSQYQLQRNRWGTGAMPVLRTENPLFVPGLRLAQRVAYAATLLGWFDSWRTLTFLLLPPLVLLTGQLPILADGGVFVAAFLTTYLLQQLALWRLGRGAYRPYLSTVFELVRMTPNLLATLTLVLPGQRRFSVTPKGRVGDGRRVAVVPKPLLAALALSFVAAVVYALAQLGALPLHYANQAAAAGAFVWLCVNAALIWTAVRRIRSLRYAGERRSAVRFAVDRPGWVDGEPVAVQDLSVGGTLIAAANSLPDRDQHLVTVDLGHGIVSIWAEVRSTRRADGSEMHYAMEFAAGQYPARAAIARAIFNGGYPVASVERRAWGEVLVSELATLSRRFSTQRRHTGPAPAPTIPAAPRRRAEAETGVEPAPVGPLAGTLQPSP
jgi:cellulose synthase (UDP-forming)